MEFLKNKFVIILAIAVLAGGSVWLYLAKSKKSEPVGPVTNTSTAVKTQLPSGSGANEKVVGDVIKKLNDLTNE